MKGLLSIFIVVGIYFFSGGFVYSHKIRYPRIVHIILAEGRIELYFNCTLPRGPKRELLIRLFDRDRDGKLERSESLALGRYLSVTLCRPESLFLNGKSLFPRLVEVEESSIRGDRRQGNYAWDIHFSVNISDFIHKNGKKKSIYYLTISIPRVAEGETVPVGLILFVGKGWELLGTESSYILRRRPRQEAVCLAKFRGKCRFGWRISRGRERE